MAACRRQAAVVVADEQEAEDGGEFPEEVEDHRVVGRDKAEHRPGEGDEHRRSVPGCWRRARNSPTD